MNKKSKEYQELLNIIKAVLQEEENLQPLAVNYNVLYRIAKSNGVANTVADRICERKDVPEEIKDKFRSQKMMIVAQQTSCDYYLQKLYSCLKDKKIKGIFLKGTLLRSIYPLPFIRSMSDIDVYAEEKNMDGIYSLMVEEGYVPGTIGYGNHYEYMQGRMVKVEYHPELVALESDYGKNLFIKLHPEAKSIASYMDIWNHTIPIDANEYSRQLVPEYHYLYVVMHMMNHFLTAGTGIRSFMDIWIMNHHYEETWDRDLIDSLLEDYGLSTFEKYAVALACKWFGALSVEHLNVDDDTLELYEAYILDSGTYGSMEHFISRQMDHQIGVSDKTKFLFGRFFLPYKHMKGMYPELEKVPVLLPVFWVYRFSEIIYKRRQSAKYKLKAVASVDSEIVEKQKELFDLMMD